MKAYRNYMLSLLLVVLAFNYVDRIALGLLLQDIKTDLMLSDTQLGLMTGIAFALFYSLMGIPLARWADRGDRVWIVTLTTVLWSVTVALSAAAGNFVQLLLIRIGVAVGEAGCVPTAHSLLADYFNREERPKAVAIYKLGIPLSVILGYFVTGWLNDLYGWRMAFILLGLPGVALALLAAFTLREPRRAALLRARQDVAQARSSLLRQPDLKEVACTLWANTTFRHLVFGYSVVMFFGSGISQWNPTFFIRSYGLGTGELGTWFAVTFGVGGMLGVYLGGVLASRYAAANERLQLLSVAVVYLGCIVTWAGIYLSTDRYVALVLVGANAFVIGLANAPFFAVVQTLVPERMRAMSIALLFLLSNLMGLGLGPLVVGILSDAFQPWAQAESLRYALLALCPGYLWAAWHLWRASRTVMRDLRLAD